MDNLNALDVLQACINELNLTTKEEFDNKRKKLGIYNKTYNREEYLNDEVEILFELDKSIDVQQNDLILEYENEINLLLEQDDDYNVYNQKNSIVTGSNYITSISLNCEEPNTPALAA